MKKLLAALLFCAFCTSFIACQPTPDKPIVESKNDGELEAAVYGEQAPEYANGYENPGTWQEVIESGDGITKVNIDAKLTIPNVTMYPVYRVEATDITQEEADRFIKTFAGDNKLYMVTGTRTKAVIQSEIDKILNTYSDPESRINRQLNSGEMSQEEYDSTREYDMERASELQKELVKAPDDMTLTEIDTTLEMRSYEYIEGVVSKTKSFQGIFLWDEAHAGNIAVQTEASKPHGYDQVKSYMNYTDVGSFSVGELSGLAVNWSNEDAYDKINGLNGMKLTYDEAKAFADSIVYDKLGYTDWHMERAYAVRQPPTEYEDLAEFYIDQKKTNDDLPEIYNFYYTPMVDGIPLQYYTMEQRNKTKNYGAFNNMVYPHCLVVALQDEQSWSIYEQSSMKLVEKLNSNVKLLPFDEIKEIFKKYIFMKIDPLDDFMIKDETGEDVYDDGVLLSATFNVTDIRLGYMRIPEKNNTDYGLLVPVWNFYGNQRNKYSGQEGAGWRLNENNEKVFLNDPANSFLCINALDGSIIDLNLGY